MKNTLLTLLLMGLTISSFSQESYTLSDASTLTIDGSSSLHDWTVTANTMEGTVAENGESITAVDFSVAVADILSDRAAAMDNKMHDALKKEEHPKVTFTVKDVNAAMGENQELKGKLTIAGVEQEVSVPTSITQKDGKLQITGESKIALKDYNIKPPTAMFGSIVVGDDVTVKFDLVFTKS
ncbi:Polyisoprenoid-binding protein YceI [Pricia antarctica]|uniref:Polyisoprenoid-binding protein YceI n=1 Tax=Pricia antarctica TaxID=641691 RepID=A0A1G6Y8M5_9FLAO|nr:YceI family protein [Pricia antarctica]SDD86710.1 Polyisoprenoid-binding protein YceI [Pricia antarctica]